MRIVDFHTFPDGSEQRSALLDAAEAIDLGELTTVTAVAPDAPIAFAFPDDLSEDEIRERAQSLADELTAKLDGETVARFEFEDAEADSPTVDHVE